MHVKMRGNNREEGERENEGEKNLTQLKKYNSFSK